MELPNKYWTLLFSTLIIALFCVLSTNAQTETYVVPPLEYTNILPYVKYSGVIPAANTSQNNTSGIPDSTFDLQYYKLPVPPTVKYLNVSFYNVFTNDNASCENLRIYVSGMGFPCNSMKYPNAQGYVCSSNSNSVQWSALAGFNASFILHTGYPSSIVRPGGYLYAGVGRDVAATSYSNCSFSLYITSQGCPDDKQVVTSNVFDYGCYGPILVGPNTTYNMNTQNALTVYELSPALQANQTVGRVDINVTSSISAYVNAYARSYSAGDYLINNCGSNSSSYIISGTTALSSFSCYAPPPGRFTFNIVRKYASSSYSFSFIFSILYCSPGTVGRNCEYNLNNITWSSNGTFEYQVLVPPATIAQESWVYWKFDEPSNDHLEIKIAAYQTVNFTTTYAPYLYLRRGSFPYSGKGGVFGGFEWTPRMIGSQNATFILQSQDLTVGGSYFVGILNKANTAFNITLVGTRKIPTVTYTTGTGAPDLHSSSGNVLWVSVSWLFWMLAIVVNMQG